MDFAWGGLIVSTPSPKITVKNKKMIFGNMIIDNESGKVNKFETSWSLWCVMELSEESAGTTHPPP